MNNKLVRHLTKVTLLGLVVNVATMPLTAAFAEDTTADQVEVQEESSTNQAESQADSTTEATENAETTTHSETIQSQESNNNPSHDFLFEGLETKDGSQPYQPQDNRLVLRSVGDLLIHDRVSWMADTDSDLYQGTKAAMIEEGFSEADFLEDAEFDFMPMLNYIKPYTEYADVTVANMEIIAAYPDLPVSGYPSFNAPNAILGNLKNIGIDILSNATNHTLDWSSQGVYSSLKNIQDAGLEYYGSYESWDDYRTPRIIEKNGIKLGFLAYSYGTNGVPVPAGEEYLINLIDLPVMLAEIEKLKPQVDAVVVSLQLGGEYDTLPNEEQFSIYQALSDAGVSLILGGHPHCVQPYDWYNGDQTFAIYSQASFLTGQRELDNKLGGITEVTFKKDAEGNVKVENPKFMPTFNLGIEAEKMYQVVPLADYELYHIPDGELWWETIKERMNYFGVDAKVMTHLETSGSKESEEIMR